jgi:O-antigen ligase
MAFLAFVFYLVFTLIRPQEFVPALAETPVVMYALIVTAVLLLFEKNKRIEGPPGYMLIGLTLVIAMSSAVNGWLGGAVLFASNFLSTAVLPFFVIAMVVNSYKRAVYTFLIMTISAVVMVSNGITQRLSEDGIGWAGVPWSQGSRITYLGVFNDPNDLSMFLLIALPLTFVLLKHAGFFLRIVVWASAAMMVLGVYLTNSRGGVLGLLALAGAWAWQKYGAAKSIVLGLLMTPMAFFVLARFRAIDPDESSASSRLDAWYQGILMLRTNPIFGFGQNSFLDHHHLTAHNSFVLVMAELGLSGYLLWAGFIFFAFIAMLVLWKSGFKGAVVDEVVEEERFVAKCLTFSMIGFLTTGFFLSRSYAPILYLLVGLMMATFYRAVSIETSKSVLRFSNYMGPYLVCSMGMIVFVYVVVRLFI